MPLKKSVNKINLSNSMDKNKKLSLQTLCVKDKKITENGESHVLPLHATSAYSYLTIEDSIDVFAGKKQGYVYSRYGNPTVQEVENKLAEMESHGTGSEAACVMTSSGLSAISTMAMSILDLGDEVLTQPDLYGGSTEIFNKIIGKYKIKTHKIDLNDLDKVEQILKDNPAIKLVYFETPSNPTLNCVDIEALAGLASRYNAYSAIDNTFATCYLQQPIEKGVDFVLYSTTKFLNGHGNSIAGAIISKDPAHRAKLWETMKLLGTNCNAWDAWLLHNGLKTLSVRMDRHCYNAMAIAEFLSAHSKVTKVNYPGLESHRSHAHAKKQMSQYGGMMSFEVKGGMAAGMHFMNATKLCSITATLGNVDTLLLHPASSSHLNVNKAIREASGISNGLIRMSVGIENVEDLKSDINHALSGLS